MSASSYQLGGHHRHSLEYRWTVAAGMALACCTIGLAAATVLLATRERFEYRPDASALTQYGNDPARHLEAPKPDALPGSSSSDQCAGGTWPYFTDNCLWAADIPKRRRIELRLKSPWCSGVLSHQPFYSCRLRPK